jgi:hypothetical protein
MSLIRQQLIQLAKSQYKGNWTIASQLFKLYDFLGDLKEDYFQEEYIFVNKGIYKEWKEINREIEKHITVNEELEKNISFMIQKIQAYIARNRYEQNKLTTLARKNPYKQLVFNLISYIKDFFKSLNIKVKTLTEMSNETQLKIYHILPDLSPDEEVASELTQQNLSLKKSIWKNTLKSYKEQGKRLQETDKGFFKVFLNVFGKYEFNHYISPDIPYQTFSTEEDIIQYLNKKQSLDNLYPTLTHSQGNLIDPNGQIVGNLDFLPPTSMNKAISAYNDHIEEYNKKLEHYENKLSNNPTTIKLSNDFSVLTQKAFFKNLVRPIIIQGLYKGLFLDQIISSTGKILGSNQQASPYFSQNRQILDSIEQDNYTLKEKNTSHISNMNDYNNPYFSPENISVGGENYDQALKSAKINTTDAQIIPKLTGLEILSSLEDTSVHLSGDSNLITQSTRNNFVRLTRTIDFNHKIITNGYFKSHQCLPEGLGSRVFVQQVKTAQENNFYQILTLAAQGDGFVGYYVWPKLGYNTKVWAKDMKKHSNFNELKHGQKLLDLLNWLPDGGIGKYDILDIYACKINGKFIGQELWKDLGYGIPCSFDLAPNSKSMRVLNKYVELKSKKDGIPISDFLNIDYSKYQKPSNDISCLFIDPNANKDAILKALPSAIINHENGQLVNVLKNTEYADWLLNATYRMTSLRKSLETIAKIYKINFGDKHLHHLFQKTASSLPSEDATIKDLDFSVLNQTWDFISNSYY